jgi:iron complex transport system substrate-binding protein
MQKFCRLISSPSISWFWALLGIAIILAACNPNNPSPSKGIVDDLGRSVNIEKMPQRIISLAPSNTEILFALGLGDRLVGVTEYCDYPPEALDKEKIGGFSTPDIEKVIALQPDLILAGSIHAKEVIPALEERDLTVFALVPENLEGILKNIEVVGKITGKEKEAFELITQLKERIEAITDKTERLKTQERPRVFFITWHDPLKSMGSKSLPHELIEKAGGVNIFQDVEERNFQVEFETVVYCDPQVIIVTVGHAAGEAKAFEWAKEEPRLKVTEASKNSRIFPLDTGLTRYGPRAVDALEEFAKFIHPDIFGAIEN